MTTFSVRVIPNASRAEVAGWLPGGVLKLKVCAPPEGGRANDAVAELLSDTFGVSRRAVRIVSGQTARNKRVEIDGIDSAFALSKLPTNP